MLKFLLFALIIGAVIAFFVARQSPKRPPRDWRHGGDDGGPILPGTVISSDTSRKPANDTRPDEAREPALTDSGSDSGGGDGGGDGGGGGGD
jgi:hypothetical protein